MNRAASWTFIPGQDILLMKGEFLADQDTIQQYSITSANQICTKLIFILANVSGGRNFTYHIDVYKGEMKTTIWFL